MYKQLLCEWNTVLCEFFFLWIILNGSDKMEMKRRTNRIESNGLNEKENRNDHVHSF